MDGLLVRGNCVVIVVILEDVDGSAVEFVVLLAMSLNFTQHWMFISPGHGHG